MTRLSGKQQDPCDEREKGLSHDQAYHLHSSKQGSPESVLSDPDISQMSSRLERCEAMNGYAMRLIRLYFNADMLIMAWSEVDWEIKLSIKDATY